MSGTVVVPLRTGTRSYTTLSGTACVRTDLSFGGDAGFVVCPSRVAEGARVAFVSLSHGYTETHETMLAPRGGLADLLLDKGWVVGATNNHGFQWGNEKALTSLRSLHAYAAGRWEVDQHMMYGGSMGGLTVLNALRRGDADATATVALVSVVDTQAMGGGYHGSIMAAYGVGSMSELTVAQAGYDPARDDPSPFSGKNLWLNAGTSDTLVVKESHGDVLADRWPTPETLTYRVGDNTHGNGMKYLGEIVDYLSRFAPDYDESQSPVPAPPVVDRPVRAPHPGEHVIVRMTDGAVVDLRDTRRRAIRLQRPGQETT